MRKSRTVRFVIFVAALAVTGAIFEGVALIGHPTAVALA